MIRILRSRALLIVGLVVCVYPACGGSRVSARQTKRPAPPTRDPHTPGYVTATELPDGSNPTANADGNFILGPTHDVPAAMSDQAAVPRGTVIQFTMKSSESKIYRGIARDAGTFGTPDPANPARLIVTTSTPRRTRER